MTTSGGSGSDEKETGRLEAFSDGVFAIAITLLILEIKVPDLPEGSSGRALATALGALWPSYFAFVTSFVTIFIMWASHHVICGLLRKSDAAFRYTNGLLLLFVTFVPFPTAVLAEYMNHPAGRAAAAFYAGTFVAISVCFNLLWKAAISGRRLLRANASEEIIAAISRGYRLGIPGYLAAAAAAFVSEFASIGICAALAVYWIIVGRKG